MRQQAHNRISAILAIAVAALITAGCANTGQQRATPQSDEQTLDRIQDSLDTEGGSSDGDPPKAVEQALMPEEEEPQLPAALSETRFDIDVDNAPARAFFMGLVEGTPYNMVVHPDVEGTLTLELKDVTVPDVMEIARRVYGYEYEKRDNGYVVTPARMQSRIFHVDYLDIDRGGESNMRVSSGSVSEVGGQGSDGGSGDDDSGGGGGGGTSSQRNPGSQISTESDADFWQGLERTVASIIGDGPNRSVVVDPEASLVVVRAMPSELRDVGAYLKAAESNLQRQVILEAKVLEVRLSESNQTGINWKALASGGSDQYAVGQSAINSGSTNPPDNPVGDLLSSAQGAANLDFGGLFSLGANTGDFNALIRLLNTQGDVQVLSSPRVSTLNNQKAVIKVGSDEFFVTDVESDQDTTTGGTQSQSVDVDLTPFFSGIALDVTPQIGQQDEVTLHVHPTVSEVRDQQKTLTVAGEQQSLPLAFSQVRESDSVVRASDGEVIVIGGLMQDESTQQRAQPGPLGNLPLVGGLFRQNASESLRSELVILLRPVIADGGDDWSQQIDDAAQRIEQTTGGGAGAGGGEGQ